MLLLQHLICEMRMLAHLLALIQPVGKQWNIFISPVTRLIWEFWLFWFFFAQVLLSHRKQVFQ